MQFNTHDLTLSKKPVGMACTCKRRLQEGSMAWDLCQLYGAYWGACPLQVSGMAGWVTCSCTGL